MVFSPVIARGCTSSLGSWTQWFSLPSPITRAGMTRGSDVRSSSPTSRCGLPSCAPPACGPPSCACPSYVALSCSASLAEVVGSHPSFPWPRSHTTPSCAAPSSGSRGGISSSVLSPSSSRPVSITSCAPTLGAWGACLAEALPICRGTIIKGVSDELPKAPRKRGEKVNFFFEDLSLVPETREVKEHFKLVFGSGTSDLAKIRPLKNWHSPDFLSGFALWNFASTIIFLDPACQLPDRRWSV